MCVITRSRFLKSIRQAGQTVLSMNLRARHLCLCSQSLCDPIFERGHTVSQSVKKSLIFGLTQQFLKDSLYKLYDIGPISYYLQGFLDPNFLTNNVLTYLRTVLA